MAEWMLINDKEMVFQPVLINTDASVEDMERLIGETKGQDFLVRCALLYHLMSDDGFHLFHKDEVTSKDFLHPSVIELSL